jgi:hypothetical protein
MQSFKKLETEGLETKGLKTESLETVIDKGSQYDRASDDCDKGCLILHMPEEGTLEYICLALRSECGVRVGRRA